MNGMQRAIPSRPSQDFGYGGNGGTQLGGQNGYDNRPGTSRGPPRTSNGAIMLDTYRNELMNGSHIPRINPVYIALLNTTRPQSSMLLNVNDPIQVHLLVEMALGDSKEFEILSQEEVDDLKKQVQVLTQRADQTRQNLAIQSKYRDAAISMSKLYSPSHGSKASDGSEKKRRSILGHRSTNSMQEADTERLASERKCEELAADLWSLEKRLMEPQSRLLKHTAGILQMTHKGPKILQKGAAEAQQGGIPGSPESMYTYSNARSSLDPSPDDLFFDERSQYRGMDWSEFDGLNAAGGPPPKNPSREQIQMISKTEARLQELNSRLREVIVKANPNRRDSHGIAPLTRTNSDGRPSEAGETLQAHLDYLEKSISTIGPEEMQGVGGGGGHETALMDLWDMILSGEADVRKRKQERRETRAAQGLEPDEDDLSADDDTDPNEIFSIHAFSAKVRWLHTQAIRLKDQKKVLQRQIKQQRELNSKSDATKDAEMYQKTEELERTKDLLSRTEMDADSVREQLNLVMDKLDEARDQSRGNDDSVAMRQAQEEFEERNEMISALEEELQELKDDHAISSAEIQTRISDSEAKVAGLTAQLAAAATVQLGAVAAKEKQLEEKEKELEGMNMKLAELQTEVTIARAELDGAYGTRAQRAAEVAANPVIQKEIDDLTRKNASLADEVAQLKAKDSGRESDEKVKLLKKELEETIEEYELMTKASIEWEKERESLEGTIDKLRDEREGLQGQLSDEKVRWLGMKSPGLEGQAQGAGSTSTTVLKNEFKKMMRDTRAENQKALRIEQAERRRLEDELRVLKRQQRPGKSGLSQSIGSS